MRRMSRLLGSAAGLALLIAGNASAQDKEYKIGSLNGLSGLGAQIGQWVTEGAEAACDQLGKTGGLKCTVIAEDSQWAPQKGVDGFNKLLNVDNIDFLLSGGSAVMEAIAPLATQAKLVVMNTGAQSPQMAGISPYIFSVLQLSDFDTGVLSAPISFSVDDHAGVKSGEMMTEIDGKLASVKTWPSSKK